MDSTYCVFNHMDKQQQAAVDLQNLTDIVRMAQPKGVAFRDVDVHFFEHAKFKSVEMETDLSIRIEASANPESEVKTNNLSEDDGFAKAVENIPVQENGIEQ